MRALDTDGDADSQRRIRRLMLFFAVVYLVEGIGQAKVGVIWQPLNYYLKQVHGWTPVEISLSLAVLDLPWVIKPVFGLVSDFVPLFGYRRRAYLLVANLAAVIGYGAVTMIYAPGRLVSVLLITAFAMAIASTVCGALLVENGQRHEASGAFVTQQWLWFNVATMATAFLGGSLIGWFTPIGALRVAAAIAALAPFAVVLAAPALVEEERSGVDLAQLRRTFRALLSALAARRLWLIAGFLFLYYFSPGIGTPLYFHLTDRLRFSQEYIGVLSAVGSAGWIAGALLHRWMLGRITLRRLLNLSVAMGTLATLAFLLLVDPLGAAVIYFLNGMSGMIANIATLTLAADFCPRRSEGFVFAALASVVNLATPLADNIGSYLYERAFAGALAPLILVSAAATALVFVLVPLLRLGDKKQGTPAA
ncbi:MAG: MFS transporter [Acetobacteraceae bacterium]|nr:MFS transporter [Acetobacteraceae bacterium]